MEDEWSTTFLAVIKLIKTLARPIKPISMEARAADSNTFATAYTVTSHRRQSHHKSQPQEIKLKILPFSFTISSFSDFPFISKSYIRTFPNPIM